MVKYTGRGLVVKRPAVLSKVQMLNLVLGVGVFSLLSSPSLGHTPSTAGTFRKKVRKNSRKTPETLSERFLEFPSRVRLGCPKPYNSRHLRLPEHFQNSLPPSTARDASFFRSGSGEGLSEPVVEFPAVLGVSLILSDQIMLFSQSQTPTQHAEPSLDLQFP